MAAIRRVRSTRRKSNKIPLNFVVRSRGRRPGISLQKEIIAVTPSSDPCPISLSDHTSDQEECYSEEVYQGCNVEDATSSSTEHTKRKEKMAEKWNGLRYNATKALVEGFGLPGAMCSICGEKANVRCVQCGPCSFYCHCCAILAHKSSLYHHFPEIWKDICFVPLELPEVCVNHLGHVCDSQNHRSVTCFHIEGVPRKLKVAFCPCEPDALTLMRLRYWPGTPSRPLIAFSFDLMDWMEVLLLECQVAVQDFTTALELKIREKFQQMPCNIYPVFIDAFEEYRFQKRQIQFLKGISDSYLVRCPACPKTGGTVTISLDGNFGLCRKKAAGCSVQAPLSKATMFLEQSGVDEFITNYTYPVPRGVRECNDFLAGSALRSNSRYARLDETGIMGAACRHEYPLCFLNLRHGERLSYSVLLLKKLREMFPDHHIQLMYDVACILKKHLTGIGLTNLLEKTEFAIPVFHAYGHKLSCQIEFNPRNISGFGLSDGEVMERLWSYLRRFSPMTKEMRPSHRIDVLTDGLLHYSRRSARNMCQLLKKRLKHAQCLQSESMKKLQDLINESAIPFTERDVMTWLQEEKNTLGTCRQYCKSDLTANIRSAARERLHLLRLKSKYADGQKIAIRLSRRITTVTKRLKTLLNKYNARCTVADQLSWEDAVNLTNCSNQYTTSDIPDSIKNQAVRLVHQRERAAEEVSRLKSEMQNCIDYYKSEWNNLSKQRQTLIDSCTCDPYTMGSICLLTQHIRQCDWQIAQFTSHSETIPLGAGLLNSSDAQISQEAQEESNTETGVIEPDVSVRIADVIADSESISDSDEDEMDRIANSDTEVPDVESGQPVYSSTQTPKDSSESSEEEEMEVQKWRGERFLRETFLNKHLTDPSTSLSLEDRQILENVKEGPSSSVLSFESRMPQSFLNRPPSILRRLLQSAQQDANRIKVAEALSKGPYFPSKEKQT